MKEDFFKKKIIMGGCHVSLMNGTAISELFFSQMLMQSFNDSSVTSKPQDMQSLLVTAVHMIT